MGFQAGGMDFPQVIDSASIEHDHLYTRGEMTLNGWGIALIVSRG